MREQIGYSQVEAAQRCGRSPSLISAYVGRGVIPAGEIQVGRRRLFSGPQIEWLVKFFSERKHGEQIGKYRYVIDGADQGSGGTYENTRPRENY